MAKDAYFRFRLSDELLKALHARTENISGYLRELIRVDLQERPGNLSSIPRTPYVYHAQLVEVIDGDTVQLLIDLGFEITHRIIVRLDGVNAPEIKTAKGKQAREFVQKELKNSYLVVETKKRGKYGRYIAGIHYHKKFSDYSDIMTHGKNISTELLNRKLARRYHI